MAFTDWQRYIILIASSVIVGKFITESYWTFIKKEDV